MTRDDLFRAIGEVEESRLARCGGLSTSEAVALEENDMKSNTERPRRRMLRVLLIAAALSALIMAVAADKLPTNRIEDGTVHINRYPAQVQIEGIFERNVYEYDVDGSYTVNEDAPGEIETFYCPRVPEEWVVNGGGVSKDTSGWKDKITSFDYGWNYGNYSVDAQVTFVQKIANKRGRGGLDHFSLPEAVEIASYMMEMEDIRALVLEIPKSGHYPAQKRVYWCDGDYLFELHCPMELTDRQIMELIASLEPVEYEDLFGEQ